MQRITYTFIAITVLALMTLTACEQHDVDNQLPSTNSLSMGISLGELSTRAITSEESDLDGNFNEKVINSLDIFFYKGEVLKWHTQQVDYESGTQKAVIPITQEKRQLFEGNNSVSYDVYVVANNSADLLGIVEGASNLSILKQVVMESSTFVTLGGKEAQPGFLMDGMISSIINLNNPDIGTVSLKRAAAKIRLNLIEVNVPGYTVNGTIKTRLVHFTNKSVLMDNTTHYTPAEEDWNNTDMQEMSTSIGGVGSVTTAAPFYAYANDWTSDKSKETYMELYIPLKKEADITYTYRYRIPLTPRHLTGGDMQYMHNLKRNFLYDISATVRILGSIDEPPVEVTGNYIIKDWSTQELMVDIKGSHYLVVSEKNVIMPNINSYTLNFNSSIPNVTLVAGSLKATYTFVNTSTGLPETTNVATNQVATVTVTPNVASGNISISSPVPVNFIPKDIVFQITNGQLTETVTIRQLSGTYFTVTRGVASNHYTDFAAVQRAGLNNPYMYAITSLTPDGNIVWGFPPTDARGNTVNSAEVANMVSPRFEMASQFGASLPKGYSDGQDQCNVYWEKAEDGTIKEGWRLPTEAEIKYIDALQNDSNNPQGMVMTGQYYWDAYSANGAYKMTKGSNGTSTSAYVRCIRDIKN